MKRSAIAVWTGSGKEGKGNLTTDSKILDKTQYSFSSRFEDGKGTNPEELIAAAHAGCFAMKLSFVIGEAGFVPEKLTASCETTFKDGAVVKSHLKMDAIVPGMSEDTFAPVIKDAKENCPISKLLNTEITMEYTLRG